MLEIYVNLLPTTIHHQPIEEKESKTLRPVSDLFVCIHFVGCTFVEGQQEERIYGSGFSQAIATAITSSFSYKSRYVYGRSLFPTIQVSKSGFEIFLYDSETDILLMNSFEWLPTTIVYLWAVLHYHLLLTATTKSSDDFKCNYRRFSDEFGGLTRFEGRTKFAVPIANISSKEKDVEYVLFRSRGGKRKRVLVT